MFKKITALLLLTAFTNVYAVTPIQQANELNKTFDSLNYKLNVEWNQKDVQFFDASIAEFEREIADLQAEGISNKDLIAYTTDKIKDKQIQNDINEMSKVIAETQMSNEEARAYIISRLSSTYSQGASWSGRRIGAHTAIVFGVIVLILICCHKKSSEKHPCDGQTTPTYDNAGFSSFSGSGNHCASAL
ncbi:MAG: hypothetical protein PHY93_00330 [Bacteriovorax sp.]|nr:hypothetical protein [Bacteriovorax sp.]